MPNHTRVCPKCSMPQKYVDLTWKYVKFKTLSDTSMLNFRCSNPSCAINPEIKTEFDELESFFDMGNVNTAERSVFSQKKTKKIKKKPKDEPLEMIEEGATPVTAPPTKKFGRPRS